MRILVFGAGAMGSLYGWVLTEAGHEITHFVRRRRAVELTDGLALDVLDGRHRPAVTRRERYAPRVMTHDDPLPGHELILVSVRHHELPAALPQVADLAAGAPVLFLMSLWTGAHDVDAALPRSHYVWGMPAAGGTLSPDGLSLQAALLPAVAVGSLTASATGPLDRVTVALASADLKPRVRHEMEHWSQVVFAIAAGLIGASFKSGGIDQLERAPAAMREAVLAVRDALLVCERLGVDVRAFREVMPFYLSSRLASRLIPATLKRNQVAQRMIELYDRHPERAQVLFDVLETGRELGVEMPHLTALERHVPGAPASHGARAPTPPTDS
jgi:2-dehydropantoate 2-reductase